MTSASPAPRVSVVMALHDGERFVVEACRSVLRQTVSDLELVVVDDGSTDTGPDLVAALGDTRVRLVRSGHQGVAAARNLGVAQARGEFVTWQDADDTSAPHRLELLLAAFTDGVALVHHDVLLVDAAGRPCGYQRGCPTSPDRVLQLALRERLPINPVSVMVRRSDLAGTAHPEGQVLLSGAEVARDLAHRLRSAHVPEPLYSQRLHPGTLTATTTTADLFAATRRLTDSQPLPDLVPTAFQSDWSQDDAAAVALAYTALCWERRGFALASAALVDELAGRPVGPAAEHVVAAVVALAFCDLEGALRELECSPRNAFTAALLGDVYVLAGALHAAAEAYADAAQLDPTSLDAASGLAAVGQSFGVAVLDDPRRRLTGVALH